MRIDELDRQIIAQLTDNARASFREIGYQVGLSAPAVKRRVDRLVEDGVISGFSARLNPDALGWHAQAWVSVTYAGNVTPNTIRGILEPIPQVVAAYTVSGNADVLVQLRAADMADLERSLEKLRATGAVARTESTIVLSTLLERSAASTSRSAPDAARSTGDAHGAPGATGATGAAGHWQNEGKSHGGR